MDILISIIKAEIQDLIDYYNDSDPVAYEGEVLGLQEALDVVSNEYEISKYT